MKQLLLRLLRFYRAKISPHKPPMCRYYPTCSAYAAEAIEVHGLFFGGLLALRRLLRCNVLFPGGYDPVPPKKNHHRTEDDP